MLVPTLTALCIALQAAGSAEEVVAGVLGTAAGATVSTALSRLREVFSEGARHSSTKVAQTALSSAQGVLHGLSGAVLGPVLVPCLHPLLVGPPTSAETAGGSSPWGLLSTMIV